MIFVYINLLNKFRILAQVHIFLQCHPTPHPSIQSSVMNSLFYACSHTPPHTSPSFTHYSMYAQSDHRYSGKVPRRYNRSRQTGLCLRTGHQRKGENYINHFLMFSFHIPSFHYPCFFTFFQTLFFLFLYFPPLVNSLVFT